MKKTGGHISQNVVEITIKMKTVVRKPLMIKISKLVLFYDLIFNQSIDGCMEIEFG